MDQVTDPREMRKIITQTARRGYYRMDGKPLSKTQMSVVSSLIHHVLTAGEIQGLSGEDTMTMLAYHALLRYEDAMDRLLDQAMLNPNPPFFAPGMVAKPEYRAEQAAKNAMIRSMMDNMPQNIAPIENKS